MSTGRIRVVASNVDTDPGVWIFDEGAPPYRLLGFDDVGKIYVSSDGNYVAFYRGSGSTQELWVSPVNTPKPRRLLSSSQLRRLGYSNGKVLSAEFDTMWIPDSHQLLLHFYWCGGNCEVPRSQEPDWKVNADTGAALMLGFGSPLLSPDGNHVIFRDESGLSIADTSGLSPVREILPIPSLNADAQWVISRPGWKLGSSSVLIAHQLPHLGGEPRSREFLVSEYSTTDGTGRDLGVYHGNAFFVDFSPDAQLMLYIENPFQDNARVHVADLTTDANIEFSDSEDADFPRWLPDSYHFWLSRLATSLMGDVCHPNTPFDQLPIGPNGNAELATSKTILVIYYDRYYYTIRFLTIDTFDAVGPLFSVNRFDYTILPP